MPSLCRTPALGLAMSIYGCSFGSSCFIGTREFLEESEFKLWRAEWKRRALAVDGIKEDTQAFAQNAPDWGAT